MNRVKSQANLAQKFRALHVGGKPLLLPNPWDVGSAKILASLGFEALATTSGGHAGTLGRPDGAVTKTEALNHAASIVAAVDLPVSADLENCFAREPDGVAATVSQAVGAGLAGCSVEDYSGDPTDPIYGIELAVERVAAAAQTAHDAEPNFVLTARSENYLHGRGDLGDTIARLQAFQEAGADVLFAPGLVDIEDIRRVVTSVDRPVNVLIRPDMAPVQDLAAVGVARISVGGAFAMAAYGALAQAAQELRTAGTYGYIGLAIEGRRHAGNAFK